MNALNPIAVRLQTRGQPWCSAKGISMQGAGRPRWRDRLRRLMRPEACTLATQQGCGEPVANKNGADEKVVNYGQPLRGPGQLAGGSKRKPARAGLTCTHRRFIEGACHSNRRSPGRG